MSRMVLGSSVDIIFNSSLGDVKWRDPTLATGLPALFDSPTAKPILPIP